MRFVLRAFIVTASVALLGTACSSNNGTPSTAASPAPSATAQTSPSQAGGLANANNHGTESVTGKSEISIEMDEEGSDFYFKPTILKGSPGQKLNVELENEGSVTHNFSIDEQNIDQDVDAGGKSTVSVTFPQSGQVEFYCKFHRAMGMLGALSV